MTNANLDLQRMGLSSLSEFEMQEIEGGNFWHAVLGAVGGAVVGLLVAGPVGAIAGALVGAMAGGDAGD